MDEVIIVGAGVGGLTLGLALHAAGVPCRIFELAAEIRPVGVGINLLPHATRELAALGLQPALAKAAIETSDATFFNRFGQLIYQEPLGRAAGYQQPQFSIHRGDLQMILLEAFCARAGGNRLHTSHHCIGVEQDETGVAATFSDGSDGAGRSTARGRVAIACDGINSAVRKQFFPDEGEPRYSGVNMWRGVTRWKPMLSGASMVRAGWLSHGKMVIYPIRHAGADGLQLINWVAEIETPVYRKRDWNRPGSIDDFLPAFADWKFDWLDVPAFIRAADSVLEFPMVDQDPLPRWSFGQGNPARRRRAPDGAARLQWRRAGDPRCAGADLGADRQCRPGGRPCVLRATAPRSDHADRADQPHQSTRCDPARSVPANQRPAIRRDRRRDQPRRTGGAVGRVQTDRRLFEGCAKGMRKTGGKR